MPFQVSVQLFKSISKHCKSIVKTSNSYSLKCPLADQASSAEVLQGNSTIYYSTLHALSDLLYNSTCHLRLLHSPCHPCVSQSALCLFCTTTSFFLVQVEDSGKVQRLRKQCPNCGPGTFMANHFDRVYCGKCTTTFLVDKEATAAAAKGKGTK
jgi:ribosomal protein S27AE